MRLHPCLFLLDLGVALASEHLALDTACTFNLPTLQRVPPHLLCAHYPQEDSSQLLLSSRWETEVQKKVEADI